MYTVFRARASTGHPDTYHLQMEVYSNDKAGATMLRQSSMGVIRNRSAGWELSLTWNPPFPTQRVTTHETIEEAQKHFIREVNTLVESLDGTAEKITILGLEK